MNVKITLTVPIEELQVEVNKLLDDCRKRILDLSEKTNDIVLENGNLLLQLNMIDDLRKKLALVDLKLEDSYSILKGYMQYTLRSKNASTEPDPEDEEEDGSQEERSDQDSTR